MNKPLNKVVLFAVVIFVAGMLPTRAQEMPKKDATPKPAMSPSENLLQQWNDIGRKLTAMAEDFPEDKYDFKPTPAQRSFVEQMLHASGANYYFTSTLTGQKPPEGDPKRDTIKSRADLVTFV